MGGFEARRRMAETGDVTEPLTSRADFAGITAEEKVAGMFQHH